MWGPGLRSPQASLSLLLIMMTGALVYGQNCPSELWVWKWGSDQGTAPPLAWLPVVLSEPSPSPCPSWTPGPSQRWIFASPSAPVSPLVPLCPSGSPPPVPDLRRQVTLLASPIVTKRPFARGLGVRSLPSSSGLQAHDWLWSRAEEKAWVLGQEGERL